MGGYVCRQILYVQTMRVEHMDLPRRVIFLLVREIARSKCGIHL